MDQNNKEMDDLDMGQFLSLVDYVDPTIVVDMQENWENLENIDKMESD